MFIATQAVCFLGALFSQIGKTYNDDSTRGLSASMFGCIIIFNALNALLSYRIWKPIRPRLGGVTTTNPEKEGRDGFVLYMISTFGYLTIFAFCVAKRVFIENTAIFTKQDFITFGVLFGTVCVAWMLAKSDNITEPFSNSYFSGIIACCAVVIPQTSSGIQFLRIGTEGVAEKALEFALVMVIVKILYYLFVRWEAENKYKKDKAVGVLIAEGGNLISWLFVMWAFYHTQQ